MTPPRAPDAPPLASHDELVALDSIAALLALYRSRGCPGDDEAVLERAQADWRREALARARAVTTDPAALEPVTCEVDGVRYAIYGVMHGMVGGGDADYKAFVDRSLEALDPVVFENGLSWFYPSRGRSADIPDFWVLGALGSLRLGLYVGFTFPAQLWTLLLEGLRVGGGGGDPDGFDFSARYHAVDPETRRGLEEYPPLPSRLQIDYELTRWDAAGWLAAWRFPFAIVPRSLFMAGFARGFAERHGLRELALVVGDLHTLEIAHLLAAPPRPAGALHPLDAAGRAFGARGALSRRVGAGARKAVHLGLAAVGGLLGLLPLILVALLVVTWLARSGWLG